MRKKFRVVEDVLNPLISEAADMQCDKFIVAGRKRRVIIEMWRKGALITKYVIPRKDLA